MDKAKAPAELDLVDDAMSLAERMNKMIGPTRLLEQLKAPKGIEHLRRLDHTTFKNPMLEIAQGGQASAVCKQLFQQITDFQDALDPALDVAMLLVNFGAAPLYVESISFEDPCLIYFYGTDVNGSPMQLCQHVQQLSFVLTSYNREDPNTERAPFGFHAIQQTETNTQE
jgi:hypothetical protein